MAQLPAVSHVALTVTDLAVSVPWYERLLGTKPVLDEGTDDPHHTAYPLPGSTLLAPPAPPANGGARFDQHRPGLDPPPLVAGRAALKAWQAKLEGLGVPHGGVVDAHDGSGCRSAIPTTSPWSRSRLPHPGHSPGGSG